MHCSYSVLTRQCAEAMLLRHKFMDPCLTCCLVCMQPDGHCMYRAVQDQLSLRSDDQDQQASTATINDDDCQSDGVMDLRRKTADYIRNHRDDFLPFLMQVAFLFIIYSIGDIYINLRQLSNELLFTCRECTHVQLYTYLRCCYTLYVM